MGVRNDGVIPKATFGSSDQSKARNLTRDAGNRSSGDNVIH